MYLITTKFNISFDVELMISNSSRSTFKYSFMINNQHFFLSGSESCFPWSKWRLFWRIQVQQGPVPGKLDVSHYPRDASACSQSLICHVTIQHVLLIYHEFWFAFDFDLNLIWFLNKFLVYRCNLKLRFFMRWLEIQICRYNSI